jgi:protein TonB
VEPEPTEPVSVPVPAIPEQPPDPFLDRLQSADAALADGRIASPAGDSVLDIYASILAEDPLHPVARRGLADAVDAVFGDAERALLAGDFAAAEAALGSVRRVQPDSTRLRFVETQLTRARGLAAAAAARAADEALAERARAERQALDEAAASDEPAALATSAPPPEPEPAEAQPRQELESTPTPSVSVDPSSAEVSAPPSELASLLAIAWTRVRQNLLLAPAGDSALDYVERATALAPDEPDVLAIRSQLAAAVAEQARVTLESGDIDAAAGLADEAFRLGAASETLAVLDLDLAAARQAAAERAHADLLALGITRMRQDRLIAPDDDSALFYLERLQAENAGYSGLDSAWRNLGDIVARKVDAAIVDRDWNGAETWIASLERVAGTAAADAPRAELGARRLQAEYLTTPAQPGELRVVSSGSVVYPPDALRRNVEGWVDVDFIVGADGAPRDARVIGSEPNGWFEQAALASVSLYRYEPFRVDGRIYERRARLRIRFGLQ